MKKDNDKPKNFTMSEDGNRTYVNGYWVKYYNPELEENKIARKDRVEAMRGRFFHFARFGTNSPIQNIEPLEKELEKENSKPEKDADKIHSIGGMLVGALVNKLASEGKKLELGDKEHPSYEDETRITNIYMRACRLCDYADLETLHKDKDKLLKGVIGEIMKASLFNVKKIDEHRLKDIAEAMRNIDEVADAMKDVVQKVSKNGEIEKAVKLIDNLSEAAKANTETKKCDTKNFMVGVEFATAVRKIRDFKNDRTKVLERINGREDEKKALGILREGRKIIRRISEHHTKEPLTTKDFCEKCNAVGNDISSISHYNEKSK